MKRRLTLGQTLRYGVEAAGFFLLMGIFRMLDLDAASNLGRLDGTQDFFPSAARQNRPRQSQCRLSGKKPLRRAMPSASPCGTIWGRTVAEYPHLKQFSFNGADPRLHLEHIGYLHAALARGKGLLFLSGHMGNWELLPIAGQIWGLDGATVVRRPTTPMWRTGSQGSVA